jgi:alkylation response protein AidB-like acyl-CoA dehydrogenase
MVVESAVVPKSRSASLISDRPRHGGSLYRFPLFGLLSLGVAAVALGIAREAIDALTSLATDKKPMGSKRTLAQRELVQLEVAKAEGLVRSARAFVFEATEEALAALAQGDISDRQRALLRVAASQATAASAQAVDLMYAAGGGTSIYAKSPLQKHFRDVHVVTQHAMVAESAFTLAGRVLLGVKTDMTML